MEKKEKHNCLLTSVGECRILQISVLRNIVSKCDVIFAHYMLAGCMSVVNTVDPHIYL